jgi:hypothetical protein
MPGTRVRPGTPVPTGPAFSLARARLGEQAMRRAYELDAARGDVPLRAGGTAFGLELVIFNGTTLDLFSCPEPAAEFGVPEGGTHPKLRVVALLLSQAQNSARAVPFRLLRVLKDGSELVLLRESGNMLGKRRHGAGNRTLARLPDTVAHLVCFTVLTRTRRGRTRAAQIRVLTTLIDPDAYPAREIAARYAERWQVETASFT